MTKRYSARKATSGKVTLSCGQRIGEGHLLDLTVPGCQVATPFPLEPGQSVQLRVHLDPTRPMRIDLGVVRWAKDDKAGIEFIRMAGEDQLRLRFYVGYVDPRSQSGSRWSEQPLCMGY